MDWGDLRFLLEVARCRRLTTAPWRLGVTQSTVGRRLAALEQGLGARLVVRTAEGYALSPAGEAIRKHLEGVEAEARAIERAVGALDRRLDGVVRVAAPMLLGDYLLIALSAAAARELSEHLAGVAMPCAGIPI